MKRLLNKKIIIIVVILLLFLSYSYVNKQVPIAPGNVMPVTSTNQDVNVNKDSFPFQELTIPYLRARKYDSKLSELSLVSDNSRYKSYLTSYSSDGLKINGLLTIPSGDVPKNGFPAIIFIHGYISPSQYSTLGNYVSFVDYFAQEGYVVFKIDLRGHGDSEGEASGAYYSSDYIIDILNAYSALKNSDFVNGDKIGLWGHSMAGNLVMRTLAVKPDIPVIVIWAGAVYTYEDFSEYGIQDNSYRAPDSTAQRQRRRQQLFDTYGQFNKDSDFWKQVAATNYLEDIKGAVRIDHAQDDNVVDIRYSRNLNKILDGTSIVHELHEYSSGGHNISGVNFQNAMQNSVNFFDRFLK